MKLAVLILHAAFDESRRRSFANLMQQLGDEEFERIHIQEDHDRRGSLWCWGEGNRQVLARYPEATHILLLPDDAVLCRGFRAAVERAIAARPDDIFDCINTAFQFEGPDAAKLSAYDWYSTHDLYTGHGGVMPREAVEIHLAWRDEVIGWKKLGEPGHCAGDQGVAMWCMQNDWLLYRPTKSLLRHDLSLESLDGNGQHAHREALNFVDDASDVTFDTEKTVHLGKYYGAMNFNPLFEADHWGNTVSIEQAFRIERNGEPVDENEHVFITVPAYQPSEPAQRISVMRTRADLEEHGYKCTYVESPGDSLVTRGRHCLMYEFLRSTATHWLQWDADVECLDVTAVRRMLESKHHIVGGAYPWRDGSGRVVCNPLQSDVQGGSVHISNDTKCIKVREVGTGFLLVSRKCIVNLCNRYPWLLYEADIEPYVGCPMWRLFDTAIEPKPNGRMRYASEDWRFCTVARQAGYDIHVYYPPVFRHWGKTAHQGHITKAWHMGETQADVPV